MKLAEERSTLAGVLFFQSKGGHNAHAILNEHQFHPAYVVTHDFVTHNASKPETEDQDKGDDKWIDIRWADFVAQFLNKARPKTMVCSSFTTLNYV
jgi:pyocin large subunit-like protein